MLTILGMLGCAAAGLGYLGSYHWFFDLFSHFRVQYAIVLLVMALILLWQRKAGVASVLMAFVALNLWSIVPLYVSPERKVDPEEKPQRLLLQNVRTQGGDPSSVIELIHQEAPDVVVLQEISAGWVKALNVLNEDYPHRAIRSREDNFGIGLYSRWPIEAAEFIQLGSIPVPAIVATLQVDKQSWQLLATHPPPPLGASGSDMRNTILRAIPHQLSTEHPVLVAGDLNITRFSPHFARLLDTTGLIDSASGFGLQPTWPVQLPILYIPIDHVLHSRHLVTLTRRIGPSVGSDHRAVIVDLALRPLIR